MFPAPDGARLLQRHHVTFNVHNEPYPSFENRVFLHLAAGHLVISEQLDPRHGLVPGSDYIEVQSPEALLDAAQSAHDDIASVRAIRESGRAKAEAEAKPLPPEIGGRAGPEPTRYGDWEKKGLISDF